MDKKRCIALLQKLALDSKGATAMEYTIIASLLFGVAIFALVSLNESLGDTFIYISESFPLLQITR